MKLIKTPHIYTKFYVLGNFPSFRKCRNSISGSEETDIFIYKVPFTLHSLIELIHNSKRRKKLDSKLVLSLLENKKNKGFSVFASKQFPALYNCLEAYCLKMNCFMCKIVHVKYHRNAIAELQWPEAR